MGKDESSMLNDNIQETVRKNLVRQYAYYRKIKRMTQADVAERAGVSRTNITRFEGGDYNPSLEMLVKLAMALDMELDFKLVEKKSS